MKILIPLSLIVAVLLLYALWGRDWLKTKPWAVGFFAWVEPIEIVLFKKSETILAGRTLQGLGYVLSILQQVNGIDFTPILPFVPEQYRGYVNAAIGAMPLLISAIGAMIELLRNRTTKPIELVAVPDKVVAENPVVAATIAKADELKVEAVAVTAVAVAEAKAA